MRLELHCHSRHSDGADAAAVVGRLAREAGVALFCLTDHDTWAGCDEAAGALPEAATLRGLELTTTARPEGGGRPRTVHLLAYGLPADARLGELGQTLAQQRERRRDRVHEICARFLRWNIRLDPAIILANAGEATPGRPHVAKALVTAGVCRSVREAFDRFLRDGGPADVPAPELPTEDGVALLAATGARVALAHPHSVGAPVVVEALCRRWKSIGLGGIEAAYGVYAARVERLWTELADALGLVVTAGSDYHGAGVRNDVLRPGVELDEGRAAVLCRWLGVPG